MDSKDKVSTVENRDIQRRSAPKEKVAASPKELGVGGTRAKEQRKRHCNNLAS